MKVWELVQKLLMVDMERVVLIPSLASEDAEGPFVNCIKVGDVVEAGWKKNGDTEDESDESECVWEKCLVSSQMLPAIPAVIIGMEPSEFTFEYRGVRNPPVGYKESSYEESKK